MYGCHYWVYIAHMPYPRDPNDPSMRVYDGPMIDPELARTRGQPLAKVLADMRAHGFRIENGRWHSDEDPSSANAQAMIAKYDHAGKYADKQSNTPPGLRPPDHPYQGPPRGMCDECGQPEMAHDEDAEEE